MHPGHVLMGSASSGSWPAAVGFWEVVGATITSCVALAICLKGATAIREWMTSNTRRGKALIVGFALIFGTFISWVAVQAGVKNAIGVVMLCGVSAPFLYACRILLQERIAGRKLQGALGTESVDDHAAEGLRLSAGADGANDPPGMLLAARSEEVANPLADSGRLTYTTSRGMDDIVE